MLINKGIRVKSNPGMHEKFDVIIMGGSYAGLATALALGRSLRKVLVVDSGKPANRFTPHSHNFLTHDGTPPGEIATLARQQLHTYASVKQITGLVVHASREEEGFTVTLENGAVYASTKLIIATGIVDILPDLPGMADLWGKSVLHCPYCHGYEVKGERTGLLANGDNAFEFGMLLSNWTQQLTVFTNGDSTLTSVQTATLNHHNIQVVETKIKNLEQERGALTGIVLQNGEVVNLSALYTRPPFRQHSNVPFLLGCEMTPDGYINIGGLQKTSVPGVYACGDNSSRLRTVANAVSMGTTAGMMVNKELVMEKL